MAKKVISYLAVVLVILLCAFFLLCFSKNNVVFNLFGPAERFPKKEMKLHLFGQEQTSINRVLVRIYYCLPEGAGNFVIENWQETLGKAAKEVSDFYQLQFGYSMRMDFRPYPQVIYLTKPVGYFTDLIKQDLLQEVAAPHSKSLSLKTLVSEIEEKAKGENDWALATKRIGDAFVINLFVLGVDITTLEVNGMKILGLNDESNNSLVFSTGFTNGDFRDFYGSVVGHEIGHALGVAWLSAAAETRVESCTVMGGGSTRKLKDNYLKAEIKEKMLLPYD